MITELSVNNFKSWKLIEKMRLAPITGLFGSNSSGKSSLLQLLLMLKQTVDSPDKNQVLNLGDDKSLVSLGMFPEIIYMHNTALTLEWNISINHPESYPLINIEEDDGDTIESYNATISGDDFGRMHVDKLVYKLSKHRFSLIRKEVPKGKYQLSSNGNSFKFHRKRGRAWQLPKPRKCYGFPEQTRLYYENADFLTDIELAFENLFSLVHYLGPLREGPRREYKWSGAQPEDMGRRGERAVDAILTNRSRGVKISPGNRKWGIPFEEYIAQKLKELGLIHGFSVEPITEGENLYRVWLQKTPKSSKVLITDVGFGISQVLPVLVLCYYVPENSIILLEQPELHLHPSVQAGIADILIDAVEKRNVQIIFESHSEHLLLRLQRRIAERKISNNDTQLYFCEMENGESKLTSLDVDKFGNINNWPKDFFGDSFGERAAMVDAMINQQQEANQ